MQHCYSFVSQVCHWWCLPFSAGDATFLFICLPGLSLAVSALFRWRCNISIHLSPRSATAGVRPFPRAMQHSAGDATSLFVCLPCLSLVVSALFRSLYSFVPHALLVSALFRWPCSISIHLPPRLVTGGVRPFSLFLFICLPGLSLLVSALFRWPCNISIHLSRRSVTAGVRPFPLAMQHFYSSPRSVTAGVRSCPLAMQHSYSCVSQWWCPPFSAGHVYSISVLLSPRSVTGVSLCIHHEAFLFICLPGPPLLVPCSISIHLSFRWRPSALVRWP